MNPATGRPFAAASECTRADLDAAFDAAARAFHGWRRDVAARRRALSASAETLRNAEEDLARLLTSEQGKPLTDARAEVRTAAAWFDYYSSLEIDGEIIQDDDRAQVEIVRRPLGVVAAITPWNFPLAIAAWKVAPAFLAGDTVVLKPSPFTPLATVALGQLLARHVPAGVLKVVTGGDELGAWMCSHATPRKVSFTGSVTAGKHVAAAAGADLKRLTLELGGNDAAILLDDVDVSNVARRIFWASFVNNGQTCAAIKRVYVPASLHDAMVEALSEIARSVVVGDPLDPRSQLGPLNNSTQLERVQNLVKDALGNGGRVTTGGHSIDRDGYFFAPTIMTNVDNGARLVDEEQFGPVLPVIPYWEVEDALRKANASTFGLSGSVWSPDLDRAADVASELDCGTAWINTHLAVAPHIPIGGLKWSGVGVENGTWGLHEYTDLQVLHRARK